MDTETNTATTQHSPSVKINRKVYLATLILLCVGGVLIFFNPMMRLGVAEFLMSVHYIGLNQFIENLVRSDIIGGLLYIAAISAAIAWFARYPETTRFGVFLLSISWGANQYSYFTDSPWKLKTYVDDYLGFPSLDLNDTLSAVLILLALSIAVCALFVVPFRIYFGGMKSKWQLVAVATALVLITVKAVEAGGWNYDFFYGYDEYFLTALIVLAAWLALARTKLGWILVLCLCIYEVVNTAVEALAYSSFSLREPFIPIIIACLLCTPAVFRWYFPKKKLEEVAGAVAE